MNRALAEPLGKDGASLRIELGEILRVVHLCDPLFDTSEPLTCTIDGSGSSLAWERWKNRVFSPVLAPRLVKLTMLGRLEYSHDMLEMDKGLGMFLSREAAARSKNAGAALLKSFVPPRGTRSLERFLSWMADDGHAPHFLTVFAVRCGIFHIPVQQVLLTYMYREWHAAHENPLPLASIPDIDGLELLDFGCSTEMNDALLHVVGE